MLASSSTTRTLRALDRDVAARRGRLARLGARVDGREDDAEGRAAPRRALELDAAVVGSDDVLDDGQPEAAPVAHPREAVVDAVELVEDAPVLDVRDPLAVVGDLDGDAARAIDAPPGPEAHDRRRTAVLQRVREQVADGVDHGLEVGVHVRETGLDLSGEVELRVPLAQRPERVDGLVDHVGHALLVEIELLAAGFHAAPVEQALDELREALGLLAERLQALVLRRGVAPRALHRLGEEADARQRRAKLVADLRDEVCLQLAEVRLAP